MTFISYLNGKIVLFSHFIYYMIRDGTDKSRIKTTEKYVMSDVRNISPSPLCIMWNKTLLQQEHVKCLSIKDYNDS